MITLPFVVEAWTIGLLIGLIGIGGIFLIPLLVSALGLTFESAIGTSLVSFTAAGCISTAVYASRGRIDWRMALVTGGGSIVGGIAGARIAVGLPARAMALVFAAFLLFAGVSALVRSFRSAHAQSPQVKPIGVAALCVVGLVVGLGSGLTGVGGPAILVPLLLVLGVSPAIAIAVSQPNAIAASASGALGHLMYGHVDLRLAALLIAIVGSGAIAGSLLHRRCSGRALQPAIGIACIVLALWTIVQRAGAVS